MEDEPKEKKDCRGQPPVDFSLTGIKIDDTYEGISPLAEQPLAEETEIQSEDVIKKAISEIIEEDEKREAEVLAIIGMQDEDTLQDDDEFDATESSAAQRIAADKKRKSESEQQPETISPPLKGGITERWKKRGESALTFSIGGFAGLWDGTSAVAYKALIWSKDIPGIAAKKTGRATIHTVGLLWGNIDFIAWCTSLCFAFLAGYETALSKNPDFVYGLVSLFLGLLGWQLPEGKITKAIRKPAPEVQKIIKKFLDGGETLPGIPGEPPEAPEKNQR